jgi:hypothetical protein
MILKSQSKDDIELTSLPTDLSLGGLVFGQAGDLRRGLVSLSDGVVLSDNGLQTSRKYRKRCEDDNRMSSFIGAVFLHFQRLKMTLHLDLLYYIRIVTYGKFLQLRVMAFS